MPNPFGYTSQRAIHPAEFAEKNKYDILLEKQGSSEFLYGSKSVYAEVIKSTTEEVILHSTESEEKLDAIRIRQNSATALMQTPFESSPRNSIDINICGMINRTFEDLHIITGAEQTGDGWGAVYISCPQTHTSWGVKTDRNFRLQLQDDTEFLLGIRNHDKGYPYQFTIVDDHANVNCSMLTIEDDSWFIQAKQIQNARLAKIDTTVPIKSVKPTTPPRAKDTQRL